MRKDLPMRFTLFYHVAFILLCSLTTTSLPCPRSPASAKVQQVTPNPLLQKFTDPKTLQALSLNGLRFIPNFLVKEASKPLRAKDICRLTKTVITFYQKQRVLLKYDSYTLDNPTAPTVLFEGVGIPETLQFGQAFCVSMLILQVLIYTAAVDRETETKMLSVVLKHIQRESMLYDKHNPTTPGFIQSAYKIIGNQLFTDDNSSTDASSDDDEAVLAD